MTDHAITQSSQSRIGLFGLLATAAACLLALGSNPLSAGGLVEPPGTYDGSSNSISNPWWPLPSGAQLVYVEEDGDECIVGIVDVIPTAFAYMTSVDGVLVREVMDREYFAGEDVECDGDLADIGDWELTEITLDWYAQDTLGNILYFGEHTVATDHEECDHPTDGVDAVLGIQGCLDGSWRAGYDIWEEMDDPEILPGIIMMAEPVKGSFYFQEYWEDNATDKGKVLSFRTIDTVLFGEQEGCVRTKEWVPLEPGNVEHKYYCYGHGLVLVEGNAGGKTVYTDLVSASY